MSYKPLKKGCPNGFAHTASKSEDAEHQDAATFIDFASKNKKSQFNSMSKSEIKTKRLKSRGLLTRRASGEEPFATRPYGKVDPIESKQRVGITDRFIYELVEFTS